MPTRVRKLSESECKFEPIRWGAERTPVESRSTSGATAQGKADVPLEVLESRMEAARAEGVRQGEVLGRQAALSELEQRFLQLGRAIEEAGGHKARLRQEAERDVLRLALAIARRILHRQIQIDEDMVHGLIKAAFEGLNLREVTEVRAHPAMAGPIQSALNKIGVPAQIHLVPDPALEPGGLLVATLRGTYDASIDTQIEEIAYGLSDRLAVPARSLSA